MTNCSGELNYLTCFVYLDEVVYYLSMQEEQMLVSSPQMLQVSQTETQAFKV